MIDEIRKNYKDKVISLYEDVWCVVLEFYSDYVDLVRYSEERGCVKETMEWIYFLQVAEVETKQDAIDLVYKETSEFIVVEAKKELS